MVPVDEAAESGHHAGECSRIFLRIGDLEPAAAGGQEGDIGLAAGQDIDDAFSDFGEAAINDRAAGNSDQAAGLLANSVPPELITVPLTIAVPPLKVSTTAPGPLVPPLSVSVLPLTTSTTEPDTIVAPLIVSVVPLTVSRWRSPEAWRRY